MTRDRLALYALCALILGVGILAGLQLSRPAPVLPVRCVNPAPNVCPR